MSQNFEHFTNRIISPPTVALPSDMAENIPRVANNLGFLNVCDGINSLAEFQVKTPQEERACNTSYTPDLLRLAVDDEPLPPELARLLAIKVECGALSVREMAVLSFNFAGCRQADDLRKAQMPRLKAQPRLVTTLLQKAETYGFISEFSDYRRHREEVSSIAVAAFIRGNKRFTGSSKLEDNPKADDIAYLNAYSRFVGINPEEVGEPGPNILSPTGALQEYTKKFGRVYPEDISGPEARLAIRGIYDEDLKDKIFYPDPLEALQQINSNRPVTFWPKENRRKNHVCRDIHLKGRFAYSFRIKTIGPNARASKQAAAKLVLDYIGATDPNLIQQ